MLDRAHALVAATAGALVPSEDVPTFKYRDGRYYVCPPVRDGKLDLSVVGL